MINHNWSPKQVYVHAYTRLRFGRLESVRQHWRSWPRQFEFSF